METPREVFAVQDESARVLGEIRTAYDSLKGLLNQFPHISESNSEETRGLNMAIGIFVTTNLEAEGEITDLPRSEHLKKAAESWMESHLRRALLQEMYNRQLEIKRAELQTLISGRDIKATSLGGSFGVGDGYALEYSPDGPMEVTARFYGVAPAEGTIWLGDGDKHYEVRLWDMFDDSKPLAAIEILPKS